MSYACTQAARFLGELETKAPKAARFKVQCSTLRPFLTEEQQVRGTALWVGNQG